MTDKKTYLVSDLANELGVPRTTLNDWLKRFDRYLPAEMSGRRRAYTESALNVLKTVNKLRNDGLSVSKIDGELEKIFAIRPDEVAEDAAPQPVKNGDAAADNSIPQENSSALALPALQKEQFDRFIGSFEEFSRLEKNRRRGVLYVWLVIVLLALFSTATAWYMARLVKLQAVNNKRLTAISRENAAARVEEQTARKANKKAIASQKQAISELKESLLSARSEQQKQMLKVEQSSKDTMNEMNNLILSMQKEQQAFRKSLENRFEQELQKRDKALEKSERQFETEKAKVLSQQKELENLRKEKEQLVRQLEEMKKNASALETKAAEAEHKMTETIKQ